MKTNIWPVSFVIIALILPIIGTPNSAKAAGNTSIYGVVIDSEGKPVRDAIVKVVSRFKTVARYTDSAGQYQINGLEPGQYDVTVDAFGFAIENQSTDSAKAGEVNFKLIPQMDMQRLNTADMKYLLPDTKDMLSISNTCSSCHGLETLLSRSGMPEAAWAGFLPYMTRHRWGTPFGFSEERAAKLASKIAKMFGPDGVLGPESDPDFSKIKRTPLDDMALKATITEYTVPASRPMIHSVTVDDNSGIVWFSEYDALTNNITRFDPETETFGEFSIPLPKALAHTGTVLKDGRFIVALDRSGHAEDGHVPTKLAIASADGKVETIDYPGKPNGARVVVKDPTNDDVVWIVAQGETWRLNLKTKEFKAYINPVPKMLPEGSYAALTAEDGNNEVSGGAGYAMTVDSKGIPWVTQLVLGTINRLDPDTGKWKVYHTPEMVSARGIDFDADGNIWFGDFFGHKLGKLDPKTGKVTFYQPPNPYATPYGITVDRKRGQIWYGDTHPNNASRFDIKTRKFVEYPLPTANAAVRFLGVDRKGRAWFGGFWNGKFGVVDPGDNGS